MDVKFETATFDDVDTMTAVQKVTFDDDAQKFLGQPSGGPPGYDTPAWILARMRNATVFKIVADERIIGGIIVFAVRQGHYNLGRIFIHPDYQNRGIGRQAIHFLEAYYPDSVRWTLDTPTWATRNHYFYEKMGYRHIRTEHGDSRIYEKKLIRNAVERTASSG